MPGSSKTEKWIRLGLVGRPHGLRGEVRLRLAPGAGESLRAGLRLRLGGTRPEAFERKLASVRAQGGAAPIARFDGIEGREQASAITGSLVEILAADLPPLGEDELYFHQVLGARVEDPEGNPLGEVKDVWEGGGRYYLLCQTPKGEAYLPLVREVRVSVNAQEGVVCAEPEALIYPDEVEF